MRIETEDAFRTMYKSALEPGELDIKTKELMSIVAAVSRLCEHCLCHYRLGFDPYLKFVI